MNNKIIIYATIAIFLLCSVFLSMVELKEADLGKRNVWFLYFTQPKDVSFDFTIENHSDNQNFHWEILVGKNKVQESDTAVAKGETKTIPVSVQDMADKKITITVMSDKNKKEIYKSL